MELEVMLTIYPLFGLGFCIGNIMRDYKPRRKLGILAELFVIFVVTIHVTFVLVVWPVFYMIRDQRSD